MVPVGGFPVVLSERGAPFVAVESGAPLATVAENGRGVPIRLVDSGAPAIVLQGGVGMVTVPYATNYNAKGYNAYGAYFADLTGKVKGTDYDANWQINPSQFPNETALDWKVPEGTPSTGVWGYCHVDYLPSAPTNLTKMTSLVSTFDWSYTGSANFNLLVEFWLATSSASPVWTTDQGVPNASLYELGLFLHCPEYSFHNGGALIGTTHTNGGVVYTCRQNARYITFAPQSETDVLSGSFDWRAAVDYLVFHGAITGSEWVSGYAPLFGIEPVAKVGSATHGGKITINSLSTSFSMSAGAADANYLGTNAFANGDSMTLWDLTGLAAAVAAPDMDGGNTAALLLELSAGPTTHDFIKSGAYTTVDSREMDYILFEDFKTDKGRTKFQQYIANGNGGTAFGHQIKTGFDTVAMTAVSDTAIGTLLTTIGPARQVINLGNGWYRAITVFRKAAGVTQLFYDFIIKDDAGNTNYVGDVTKGVTMRPRHRLPPMSKIVLSGTPTAAVAGSAYSFQPVARGGKSPLVWAKDSGLTGFAVNASTGEVTHTGPTAGTYTGVISATGADGTKATLNVSITATAAPLTTWDPANKNAAITLTESNRRATAASGSDVGVKSTSSRSSGKLYFEYDLITLSNTVIGLGNASASVSAWLALTANGIGIGSDGAVSRGGSNQGASGTGALANGNVLGVAIDFTAGKVWFSKNGVFGSGQDPAANTGGFVIPTGALFAQFSANSGHSVRIKTETPQLSYSPPSGFAAWS